MKLTDIVQDAIRYAGRGAEKEFNGEESLKLLLVWRQFFVENIDSASGNFKPKQVSK